MTILFALHQVVINAAITDDIIPRIIVTTPWKIDVDHGEAVGDVEGGNTIPRIIVSALWSIGADEEGAVGDVDDGTTEIIGWAASVGINVMVDNTADAGDDTIGADD